MQNCSYFLLGSFNSNLSQNSNQFPSFPKRFETHNQIKKKIKFDIFQFVNNLSNPFKYSQIKRIRLFILTVIL